MTLCAKMSLCILDLFPKNVYKSKTEKNWLNMNKGLPPFESKKFPGWPKTASHLELFFKSFKKIVSGTTYLYLMLKMFIMYALDVHCITCSLNILEILFSGLPLVFGKFSQGFQNCLQIYKIDLFGSIFSLKLCSR